MYKCSNCGTDNTDNNKYCSYCGQKRITSHHLKDVIKHFLEGFDLQRGLLYTVMLSVIWPRRLVNDYIDGRTKIYTNPFSLLIVLIGLIYLFDELHLLHGLAHDQGQMIVIINFIIPLFLASIVLSQLKFMQRTYVEMLIIFFYFLAGFLVFAMVRQSLTDYGWRYNFEVPSWFGYLWLIISYGYIPYYFISIYKGKTVIRGLTTLIVLLIFMFFHIVYITKNYLLPENLLVARELQSKLFDMPNWPKANIYEHPHSALLSSDTTLNVRYLASDLNGDEIRDIVIPVRSLATNEQELIISNYLSFDVFFSRDYGFDNLNFDSIAVDNLRSSVNLFLNNELQHQVVWKHDKYTLLRE